MTLPDSEILYWCYDDIDPRILDFNRYPGGEPIVTYDDRKSIAQVMLRPKTLESFVVCMFWVDALQERWGAVPRLVLPYVPGARQDRLNPSGDYLFTLKSVAKMINEREFHTVEVWDPHSYVTPALIDRCYVRSADQLVRGWMHSGMYSGVIAPDAGAEHRAEAVAKLLGVPLYHAGKSRDVTTGKITGFWCEPLPHYPTYPTKPFLVVDDICDGGGTFMGLADVVTCKDGSQPILDLYITHGIFSQGCDNLIKKFRRIITTESIPSTNNPVTFIRYPLGETK